jgi:DNA-binding GntR family transcriptional regulator
MGQDANDKSSGPAALGIGRTVLRDQVKTVLLERILAGRYAPGERLVETRIAQELGTSQAPVREALRELELLRFVQSAPFRGSWVREVSDDELVEVYPIRAALEEVAAREAAKNLGGDVAALEAEVRAMATAADVQEQVEHDVRFHRLIVEASGNSGRDGARAAMIAQAALRPRRPGRTPTAGSRPPCS